MELVGYVLLPDCMFAYVSFLLPAPRSRLPPFSALAAYSVISSFTLLGVKLIKNVAIVSLEILNKSNGRITFPWSPVKV